MKDLKNRIGLLLIVLIFALHLFGCGQSYPEYCNPTPEQLRDHRAWLIERLRFIAPPHPEAYEVSPRVGSDFAGFDNFVDAWKAKDEEIIDIYLKAGIMLPAEDGRNIIHLASEAGFEDLIELGIKCDLDINAQTTDNSRGGITPLHLAAKNGNVEVVKMLIEKGTHPNLKTKRERTPLQLAARNKQKEVVRFLVQFAEEKDINRAASLAAYSEDKQTVKILNKYLDERDRIAVELMKGD